MEAKLVQTITELKTEMKYIGKTLEKVEKVLENQGVLLEKQNVANKRILNLEENEVKFESRIRILEDWKIKSITIGAIIATVFSTLVGIIIKKFM